MWYWPTQESAGFYSQMVLANTFFSQVVLANLVKCLICQSCGAGQLRQVWISKSSGAGQHIFQSSGAGQLSQVPDLSAMLCWPTQASAGFYSQMVLANKSSQVKWCCPTQSSAGLHSQVVLASTFFSQVVLANLVKCRICQPCGACQLR
jgi:hypothetical protein